MQSLLDIIENLPEEFVEQVKTCDSVPELILMRNGRAPEEKAVIDARIQNINHLVS